MEKIAKIVDIVTPKKILLHGLWFGPSKAERVYILIHGLTSSAFGNHGLVMPLVDKNTSVITFSNRGHDTVAKLKQLDGSKKGYRALPGGMAHEVFTECVDDIDGVISLAKKRGAKEIYFVGHSTGCQKSVYYLSKRNSSSVKGVILLAPLSDYASALRNVTKAKLEKVTKLARNMVRAGKKHELLPISIYDGELIDAQRFLSLYTPDSAEEIFCYSQSKKVPTAFHQVTVPILVVFGELDEYRDRPIKQIATWFEENQRSKKFNLEIIPKAGHSFNKFENGALSLIKGWVQS